MEDLGAEGVTGRVVRDRHGVGETPVEDAQLHATDV